MKAITSVTTVITRLEAAGDDVLLITLADPDRWELPAFAAGAHIDLYLENGLRRAYSLCGDPRDRYHYHIAVKLDQHSRGGSRWIHRHFRPGRVVGVSLPRTTMTLQSGVRKHVLIAGGGIGITPMLSLIYQLETQRLDYALHFFYRGAAPLLKQVKQAMRGGTLHLSPVACGFVFNSALSASSLRAEDLYWRRRGSAITKKERNHDYFCYRRDCRLWRSHYPFVY